MIELLLQAERALSVGLLDRAETLYGQVAAADPRNSIAVVGLARVALDRGDETASLELARRALTIDPENVAAQRLVQRLEEVRAYRVDAGTPIEAVPEVEPAAAGPGRASAPEAAAGPEPEAEAAAEPVTESERERVPEPEAAGKPGRESEPERVPEPEAAAGLGPGSVAPRPARRRSWLDRLLRRSR